MPWVPELTPSQSPFQSSAPVTHSRGTLSFFIFLFSSRYSHNLLLGEKKEQDVGVQPRWGLQEQTCICWGAPWPASPGAECELGYSRVWVLGVEGNGQREAGLVVISTQETLSVAIVMDQVITGHEKGRWCVRVVWTSEET